MSFAQPSYQCRIKVGAIDAAALGPFVKQAHSNSLGMLQNIRNISILFNEMMR